jgi:opacity protein-like surface antigen
MNKRLILTAVAIVLALSVLAASSSVQEISFGENTDVSLGRAGLVFTYSQYDGLVKLTRMNRNNLPGEYVPKFTQHLLYTRLYDSENVKVSNVVGPVYVYFKIRGPEQRLWNKGELTIYYYDSWKNQWTECPTTFIFKPGNSRVSCRIRSMGLYGVGVKK